MHAHTGVISKSKRLIEAEFWFEELVTNLANRMPDVDRLELPACLTIRKIHAMYCEALLDKRPTPLSMSQFRRMWKRDFPCVIIPKVMQFIQFSL